MAAVFDFSVRAVACTQCGAPLSVAPTGGTTSCDHCGSTLALEPRRTEATLAATPPLPASSYDPQPFLDASGFAGKPWEHTMPRVRETWLQARARPELEGGYRLYASTLVLSSGYAAQGDHRARRAVLETALELLADRGHRCILRCHLARAANRLGEQDAATSWLSQCDATNVAPVVADELRVTEASLARGKGRPNRVLELLPSADAVTGATASLGAQLRVDALERLGRPNEALAELQYGVRRYGVAVFVGWLQANELAPQTRAAWSSAATRKGRGLMLALVAFVVLAAAAGVAWVVFGR